MRNSLTPQKESEQEKTVLLTSLLSLSSCASSVQVSVSQIWAAVVHDGSPFVEARQAGLVGAVVAVCLLLLALAKLGSAALETLSDVLETSSEMSSTSTDKFLDWKYCVALGHFSLNFSSSLFLFLFSLPLRNRFMLNFATTNATTRQIVRDRNVT